MKRNSTRRHLLQLSGGALTISLAGCLGSVQHYNPFNSEIEIDDSSPIETRENATIVENSTAEVRADGDIIVPTDFDLSGNVVAAGSVLVERDAEIDGSVEADEHVLLERDIDVNYNVRADGRVVLRADAEVGGSIDADGDVLLRDGTEVGGNITAGGNVALEGDTEVMGDVTGRSVDVPVTAGVRGDVDETG